ncbi:hypothetical protein DFH09DRAFT_1332095 [Mycena vulgaris]|nr:hypothetical protein DFH09DRAFT_1332095 [Mycena vulgaris]
MDEAAVVKHQLTTNELVVFCRLLGHAVTLYWPTHNGVKIIPARLRDWLRSRGLFLECFCGFLTDAKNPRSSQIVVGISGDVWAFCYHDRPQCRFKINLSRIHRSSLLMSSFADLPTLRSGNVPDMDTLSVAFTLRRFPPQEIAPHFPAYFGEHISGYPDGTHQLSGVMLPRRPADQRSSTRRHSSPYLRMRKDTPASNSKYYEIDDMYPRSQVQTAPAYVRAPSPLRARNAMAGPPRIPMESASSRRPAPFPVDVRSQEMEGKEVRCLRKLIDGQGISEDAWEGLTHVKCCLGQLVIY